MKTLRLIRNRTLLLGLLALSSIALTSVHSFLFFHSVAELAGIAIALALFLLVWNAKGFLDNGYLLLLGIAYGAFSIIDLLHTLAYDGMGVFDITGANLATQFWIAGRYMQAGVLLLAPLYLRRRLNPNVAIVACLLVVAALVGLIAAGYFPTCYVEGAGLTLFKRLSEYVISLMLLASLILLRRQKGDLAADLLRLLSWSIGLTIASELAFTSYVSVYGVANLLGHLLRVAAVYLLYRAIVVRGLQYPQEVLYHRLGASEARYRNVSQVVADFAYGYRLAPTGVFEREWATDSFARVMGHPIEEFDTPDGWKHTVLEDDHPILSRRWDRLVEGGEDTSEYRVVWPNGEVRWVRDYGRAIWDDNHQRVIRIVGAAQDITALKLAETRNVEQQRLAAVGQVAAGVAHDFNNRLTAIIGNAEMLQLDETLSDQAKEDLSAIIESAQQGANLVRQLLDYSRRSWSVRGPVDLQALMADICATWQATMPANVACPKDIAPGKWVVDADGVQLRQAVDNLIRNAIEAMPNGGELGISLQRLTVGPPETPPAPDTGPGAWYALTIRDTGVGMDAETQSHIFEPFFTTKHPARNIGLSLPQTQGIVHAHGGHVDVRSEPGKGSVFTVYLPVAGEEGDHTTDEHR